jgi:DNA-binding response OmpR family regulator
MSIDDLNLLPKPFSTAELLRRIQMLLGQATQPMQ